MLNSVKIKVFADGKMPEYKTDGAVCADCYAHLEGCACIPAGERRLIPLGFAIELPKGYELQVRGRSGLASKGIDVALGTVDFDYRGEIKACVINNSNEDYVIYRDDRICQIAIREAMQTQFEVVDELTETTRGDGGFGHTGIKG